MKNIAVKINYEFNNTQDVYSDGDVEDELLQIVKENDDYDKIVAKTSKFPIFYHLSKERECIVAPMDIGCDDSVLEIGAGCGAITGALAERAAKVDCIELSPRRALINAYKNYTCDNVEIFVGNYQDVMLTKQYDVITLIGVFEYAVQYFHTSSPYEDFLLDVLNKLKKNGKLYIAIENRLGGKYLSGCVEDHAGIMYEGITGYSRYKNVKTFSYYEWLELFARCGIENYYFMYPYPDYKFPRQIFSDAFLPQSEDFVMASSNYVSKRVNVFQEDAFFKSLVLKHEFKIFANSYLICITR